MVGRDVELKVVKGPATPKGVVLSIKDLHVRDDREHMAVKGVEPRHPGRRDRRAGRRPGQRPDRARRGHRRPPVRRLRRDHRSTARSIADGVAAPGLGHGRRPRPRGPHAGRPDRRDDGRPRTSSSTPTTASPTARAAGSTAKAIDERAAVAVKDYDVRTPGIDTYAGSLSGGNQQKVVVAREFSRPVKLVDRGPADARPRRRLDRVHPQADGGAARRRRRGPHRQHRAGRGARRRRPHRGHAGRPDRGHPRGRRRHLREGRAC